MSSSDGRLDLTFTPFLVRVAKTNLIVVTSELHQIFGKYTGKVISDGGVVIAVEGLVGFVEEHHAKW